MAKFVLKLNSLVFLSGLVLELTGFGFFAVYREGRLSDYLVLITGNVIIVLAHYLFFMLLLPALNIVAPFHHQDRL